MTDSERWQRVQNLVETLEAHPPSERADLLASLESDPAIRVETLSLLGALAEEERTRHLLRTTLSPFDAQPAFIGGLPILRTLGAGGSGTVYSAVREGQNVAVKLFHGHRVGPEHEKRFARECAILASLDHPHIVRILDSGLTADGRPYIVMEEALGLPLTAFADQARQSIDARLRLFLEVCSAVDFAHRRLIVHLDLKPSNILVSPSGQAKLLDFGTAKIMDSSGHPTLTEQLTPLYSSPERLRGEAITVASDVYSLGLILFELISGSWPFSQKDSMAALAERAAGLAEPLSLSTALTREAATQRSTTLEGLSGLLKGDLDAICAKALAPDPARRYPTVAALQDDLERSILGKPVSAHAPSAWYRARKFLARHGRALSAASLLVALGLYAAYSRVESQRRFEEARLMANYLLFDLYDKVNELPGSTLVRARMAQQAQSELDRLAALSGQNEAIQLETVNGFNRLADIYAVSGSSSLGETKAAAQALTQAKQILASLPETRAVLLARAQNRLLDAKLNNWNRRSLAQARPLVEEAARDLARAANPQDPDWLRTTATLSIQQADLAEFSRDFEGERKIAATGLAALDAWPANLREGSDFVLRHALLAKRHGNALYYLGRYSEAFDAYSSGEAKLRAFDASHPNRPELLYALADLTYQLAYTEGERKRPAEMLELTRRSLALSQKLVDFDPANAALRRSYWNKRQALAESLAQLGRYPEALVEQKSVLDARKEASASGLASEDIVVTLTTLGGIQVQAGLEQEACNTFRESFQRARELNRGGQMTPKNWSEQSATLRQALARCPAYRGIIEE